MVCISGDGSLLMNIQELATLAELQTRVPSDVRIHPELYQQKAFIDLAIENVAEALRDGQLAGAALDVTAVEPLPTESPLWAMPQVILSPHMSGDYIGYKQAVVSAFVDNFRRFQTEEPLLNVVDKISGFVLSDDRAKR